MSKYRKYTRCAILYGVIAILCCIDIMSLYPFVIIFALLCAFNVYFATKYKKQLDNTIARKEQEIYEEMQKNKKSKSKLSLAQRQSKEGRKALRNLYEKRLQTIEDELGEEEFDRALEEAEMMSEDDDYKDYDEYYDE